MRKKSPLTRGKKLKAQELFDRNQIHEAHKVCSQVCNNNRADAEAWTLLGMIERRLGRFAEAELAARHALTQAPAFAPAHQVLGMALQCQNRLAEAVPCYREAIRLAPGDAQHHYLLGNALRETGALAEAEACYARAIELQPNHLAALGNRGAALIALGRSAEARSYLERANALHHGLPQILCNLALVAKQGGQFDLAKDHARQALERDPDCLDALITLAELAEKSHQTEEVIALTQHGLSLDPDNAPLNLILARLDRRDGRIEEGINRLERLLTKLPEQRRADTLLLLGQFYDKRGDAERAFQSIREGNRIRASQLAGDVDERQYLRDIELLRRQFRAESPENWKPFTDDPFEDNPIFLMGFPRSGTTLLEQILDSHPQLQALDEKPAANAMADAMQRICPQRQQPLRDLTLNEAMQLRKVYFDAVALHLKRKPGCRVVDKMPLNTTLAHLIWRVFPKAKIILAIRHPCDACLSCFMQNFAQNLAMNSFLSLETTVETYAAVMSLWREYTEKLPIDYHRIRYEDLVIHQAEETQRLLDFLELEWDERLLQHHEHARTRKITTPSYHQVTKPIYQDARYRWKRYETQMAPILPTLQPFIDFFDYADDHA